MAGGLKDKIKRIAIKTAFVGGTTFAIFNCLYLGTVATNFTKTYDAPKNLYLHYAINPSENDQIGQLLDNELVWESIQPDYSGYSTLDLVEMMHLSVQNVTNYDSSVSPTDIESSLNGGPSICKGFALLTFGGLVDLFEKHPELKHHLENIRVVYGKTSNGRTEAGHAWLEVKVDDEWKTYETTEDVIIETFEIVNLGLLSELYSNSAEGLAYYPHSYFRLREDGSLKREVNYKNIFIHRRDLTKNIFNRLEMMLDKELLDRPYTNLVSDFVSFPALILTSYGAHELIERRITRKKAD